MRVLGVIIMILQMDGMAICLDEKINVQLIHSSGVRLPSRHHAVATARVPSHPTISAASLLPFPHLTCPDPNVPFLAGESPKPRLAEF